MFAALSVIFASGLYLDGWAHVHGRVDQSFFTPWHAVLYSGYLLVASCAGIAARRGWRQGFSIRNAAPPGYELSLLGAGIFLVGGAADMVWHILFGIEVSVDALYSPTHLILAIAGVLMASGPLRSAWRRSGGTTMPWSALLSLTVLLSVMTFFLQVAHPLVDPQAAGSRPDFHGLVFYQQAIGVTAVVLQTGLLMALVLLAARRFVLPFGALALVFGLNAFGLAFEGVRVTGWSGGLGLVPVALLGGLLADLLYVALRSGSLRNRPLGFRLFAAAVPATFYVLYFLALIATAGIWWSIHLWLGSVAIAAITGWLVSYVALPPAAPAQPAPPPAWQ